MLPNQRTPTTGGSFSCLELSDVRRWELAQRCRGYVDQLLTRGVDLQLAADVAEILAYRPLPWSVSDQALVRRACEVVLANSEV